MLLWAKDRPRSPLRIVLGLAAAVLFCLSLVVYFMSYPYYLPCSYPEPVRSQLRMLRCLIEAERGDNNGKAKMIPLSELHLKYQEKEAIPDSLRENGGFGGYQYTIHLNTPREGVFTLDAVPTENTDHLPSFHVFPTNPDTLDGEYAYVIYCTTMARRNGEPATKKDPHFHNRGLVSLLLGRP